MARKPENIVIEIREALRSKGYRKNIPLSVFYKEFMILSGYGKTKVKEWTENFNMMGLITINKNVINFNMAGNDFKGSGGK